MRVSARAMSNGLIFEARLRSAWTRTDEMFAILKSDGLLMKPVFWRHPFLFYIGHLPAFSWNRICGTMLKWESFNREFDVLFCRGVDPDTDSGERSWHPQSTQHWPDISAIVDYRDRVRGALLNACDAIFRNAGDELMTQSGRSFHMILEHEYIHQERLLSMLHEAPFELKLRPRETLQFRFEREPALAKIPIPAGQTSVGADFDELEFGWDNEIQRMNVDVPSFKIDSLPVTNRQFFEFLQSGAYGDSRYWLKTDWDYKVRFGIEQPRFWLRQEGNWYYCTLFDLLPLTQVLSWPVYVSLAEARAYASWRGKRLPTEAEFHRAAYGTASGKQRKHPWGNSPPGKAHGNFNFVHGSPEPVGSSPAGASCWGVHELVGNGWEWTDTPFAALTGFEPYSETCPDYCRDFLVGKHYVLKGGSWATAVELLRPSFRNGSRAHTPFVFAKFRCVSGGQGDDRLNA